MGNRGALLKGLGGTLLFAVIFVGVQGFEYVDSSVMISDGSFGSCFYLLTGFHGFHVAVGGLMLVVALIRCYKYEQTGKHHIGFEVSAVY